MSKRTSHEDEVLVVLENITIDIDEVSDALGRSESALHVHSLAQIHALLTDTAFIAPVAGEPVKKANIMLEEDFEGIVSGEDCECEDWWPPEWLLQWIEG